MWAWWKVGRSQCQEGVCRVVGVAVTGEPGPSDEGILTVDEDLGRADRGGSRD